eukprot:TRINITY_DN7127_c0_g2_i4.p1 TRINITY_DN7127_c0_g2~~TRINITY_DN7127_c0_g2_i4.p1  ORF type:complete len:487 (+),score=97.08 TRINITY_DN7127_c0_g2_i4:31-1491(+)
MALPPVKSALKSSLKSRSSCQNLMEEPPSNPETPALVSSPSAAAAAPKPALKTSRSAEAQSNPEEEPADEKNLEGSVPQKPSKEKPLQPINRAPLPREEVIAEDTDGPVPPPKPSEEEADGGEGASGGGLSKWTSLRGAIQATRRRSAGIFQHPAKGDSNLVNPLKDALINYGNREVDVDVVRQILEEKKGTIDKWIDLPLDCDGLSIMPSALIFAVGFTQAEVVSVLCEYGANPKLGYHGKNSFNGWVKPDLSPSEVVMNRVGRFKGTMLGEDLQKILEALQAAEIRLASASVQNIAKGVHSEGVVTDIYEIQGAIPGIEVDNIKLALHKTSGDAVAIKTELKSQEAGVWEELAIMRKIAHPSIIKLQGTFEDESSVHIVMDLCSGGRLFTRIAEAGGISTRVTCRFMQQMASAVAYLHEQGICHRNIEPTNFLVKELGSAMLLHDATVMIAGSSCLREFSSDQPMKTRHASSIARARAFKMQMI